MILTVHGGIYIAIQNLFLEPEINYIEREIAIDSINRAKYALGNELNNINQLTVDLAKKINQSKQIDLDKLLVNNKLDLIFVLDNNLNVKQESGIKFTDKFKAIVKYKFKSGFFVIDKATLLLDLQSINDGFIIAGKLLTAGMVADISGLLQQRVKVWPMDAKAVPSEQLRIATQLGYTSQEYYLDKTTEQVVIYASIKDIVNDPRILLGVTVNRGFNHIWQSNKQAFVMMLIVTGLLFIMVFIMAINYFINSPFSKLINHLHHLREDPEYDKTLEIQGYSELSAVTEMLDKTIASIKAKHTMDLKKSYELGAANLGAMIVRDAKDATLPVKRALEELDSSLQTIPTAESGSSGIINWQRSMLIKVSSAKSRLDRIITAVCKHTLRFNIK